MLPSDLTSIIYLLGALVVALFFVALIIYGFSRYLARQPEVAGEQKIKAWEVFTKVATIFLTIVGGFFAFGQYIDQEKKELRRREEDAAQKVREFNLRIYAETKTLDLGRPVLLNEAADLAATLATAESLETPTAKMALERFERLYHGQLLLYEGEALDKAMVDFRDALRKWKAMGMKPHALKARERTNPENGRLPTATPKPNSDFMRRLALEVSKACRKELEKVSLANAGNAGNAANVGNGGNAGNAGVPAEPANTSK